MNTKAQLTFLTSAFWLMTATALAQPIITNQPTSQSVSLGAHVTFLADATGTLPLSYQWRFDGVNLMSATNRSLAINQAQPTDAGDYAVIVANSSGSVTSRLA